MKKLFAVLKREYLATVRKKTFIVMTLLFPVLMAALILGPGFLMARGMGEKRIAVVDATGRLHDAFTRVNDQAPSPDAKKALTDQKKNPDLPQTLNVEYVDAHTAPDQKSAVQSLLARLGSEDKSKKVDAVLFIPANAFASTTAQMTYYSRSSTDVFTQERLSRAANKAIQRSRLSEKGIDPAVVTDLMHDVPVDSVQLTKSGEQKKGGELYIIFAFIFGALLMLPSFIYGVEIMRGIIQEKTDRVIEVLISSMSPTQLLVGKITGIAAVGLTQITVWLTMVAIIGGIGASISMVAGINISQFLRGSLFVYFFVFFLLAYFIYVCVYAIAGAACNTDKEAQQMIAPISMLMMLPWILMFPILTNPDSPLAVGLSMAPVYAPMTMFVRTVVTEPPVWQIAVSILVSLATIAAFFWFTSKIFRVGVLSYGKRPTIPELWRWIKVA